MERLLKQIFAPYPHDHVFREMEEPAPLYTVIGIPVFVVFILIGTTFFLTGVVDAIAIKYDYVGYPHSFVFMPALLFTFASITPIIWVRNFRKRAPIWAEVRPYHYSLMVLGIALLTTPITSYALGHHVRSNGYERCHIGTAHSQLLFAHWVRPPLTCEEVDAKTARELREAGWNVR